jgi:hypothetical protein
LNLDESGLMTGTLTGPTINATNALQESGTSLAAKYLQLSGTVDMSGKLPVLNGYQLAVPAIGDYGGNGARIILWKGEQGIIMVLV